MKNLRYIPGNRYSNISDEAKLGLGVFLSIILLMAHLRETQLIIMVVLLAINLYGGLKLSFILDYIKIFLPIMAIIFILHLFYRDGLELFKIWIFTASDVGLYFATMNLLRFVNFLLIAIGFFSFSSPLNLATKLATGFGLSKSRASQEIALVFFISLRFLPVLLRERDSLKMAMRARGANFGGGFLNKIRMNTKLVFPLILRVVSQTDDVALALALKGDGSTYFVPEKTRLKLIDYLLLIAGIAGTLAVLIYV